MKRGLLVVAAAALLLLGTYVTAQWHVDNVAKKRVAQAVGRFANIADITYEQVRVNLVGFETHVKNVTIKPVGSEGRVEISRVVVGRVDGDSDIPTFARVGLRGLKVALESGQAGRYLTGLGYGNTIECNVDLDYTLDENEREFRMDMLSVGAEGIGRVILTFRLGNVDIRGVSFGTAPLQSLARLAVLHQQILIHSAELSYEDQSLVPAILKSYAGQMGQTVPQLTEDLKSRVEESTQGGDVMTQVNGRAFVRFLRRPTRISISIAPQRPVPVGRLQRAHHEEWPAILNMMLKAD